MHGATLRKWAKLRSPLRRGCSLARQVIKSFQKESQRQVRPVRPVPQFAFQLPEALSSNSTGSRRRNDDSMRVENQAHDKCPAYRARIEDAHPAGQKLHQGGSRRHVLHRPERRPRPTASRQVRPHRVVAGADHRGDIPQRRAFDPTLPQRLPARSLEVDQHVILARMQQLAQVVIAMATSAHGLQSLRGQYPKYIRSSSRRSNRVSANWRSASGKWCVSRRSRSNVSSCCVRIAW